MNEVAFSYKCLGSFIFAVISNAFFSIAPLAILCFALVIIDCVTAWQLARRMKKRGYATTGKFRADKFGWAVVKMSIVIPTALLVAYFTQMLIFEGANLHLIQVVAGVICFWQIWSILENVSSCNEGALWARILQRVMIDKAERHLDISLDELKNSENKDNATK